PCCTAKHNAISGVQNVFLFLELFYPGQPVVLVALVNKLHVHTDLTSLFIDCFEEGHYNPMADGRNANLFLCFQEFQYDSRTDVRLAGAWWPLYGENAAVEIQRNPACSFNTAFTVFYRAAFLLVYKPGLALHQQIFRCEVVAHRRQTVVVHFAGNAKKGFPTRSEERRVGNER